MKVVILGGTGGIGQATARLLAASPEVDHIVVAGRTRVRAEEVAATLGQKASGAGVAVGQADQLVQLARGADVLVNTAGPDFAIPLPALKAAIQARTNYVDIAADGKMTDQVLSLDQEARSAGITALIGIGYYPGLSNLVAMHALRKLDAVNDIHFGYVWGWPELWHDAGATAAAWRASGHVTASWQTVMGFMRGPVRIYRNGQPLDVEPFTNAVQVSWPSGESMLAYPVDSAETRTLTSQMPGLKALTSLVTFWPSRLNELWREQSRRMISGDADPAEAVMALHEALAANPDYWLADTGGLPSHPLWMVADGMSAGRAARYSCWFRLGPLTEAALTAGTLALLRGEVPAKGVRTPEAAFEPATFFAQVAHHAGGGAATEPLFDDRLDYEDR
jgi:NAD(P)-dependent dehydrogenase (short-subunit alcohol dehydrogenase family)